MFGFSTEKAYICITFRGNSSLTITLHHFDSYTITLQHKHCTTRTNDLHRFHCFSKPPPSLPEGRSVKKASPPTPSLTPNPSPKGEGNFKGEGSRMKSKTISADGIFHFSLCIFHFLGRLRLEMKFKIETKNYF